MQLPQAHAGLTAGESVKNPRALLRYALPIQSSEIRQIQVMASLMVHGLHLLASGMACTSWVYIG